MEKTIWMVWFQGWNDNTPWLVNQVRKTWEVLNPDWKVCALSNDNLSEYVDIDVFKNGKDKNMSFQAKSDIVRLCLLSKYGGIWADATLICMIPLNDWVFDYIEPTGFWSYSGWGRGRGCCIWFIVSQKQSYIIQTWCKCLLDFWEKHYMETNINYFLCDNIFGELLSIDSIFENEWNTTPYLFCEDRYQSFMFYGIDLYPGSDEGIKMLLKNPPFVMKFSNPFNLAKEKIDAENQIISNVLCQKYRPYKIPSIQFHINPAILHETVQPKMIILSLIDNVDQVEIEKVIELSNKYSCSIDIYDKSNFCSSIPCLMHAGLFCRARKDVGGHSETFLSFIINEYGRLPNIMYFTTNSDIEYALLGHKDLFTCNVDTTPIFEKWYKKYVSLNVPNSCVPVRCFHVSKQQVLKYPKTFYMNLKNQIDQNNSSEFMKYMDMSWNSIFELGL